MHRMNLTVASILLVLIVFNVQMACAVDSSPLVIDCAELYDTLSSKIKFATGSKPAHPNCDAHLMQILMTYMLKDTTYNKTHISIQPDFFNKDTVEDWVVYAFLGKQVVFQDNNKQTKFLEYADSTSSSLGLLTKVLSNCEYQQPLYLTLIVVLILMLLAVMLWPYLHQIHQKNPRTMTSAYSAVPQTPIKSTEAAHPFTHTNLRLRLP